MAAATSIVYWASLAVYASLSTCFSVLFREIISVWSPSTASGMSVGAIDGQKTWIMFRESASLAHLARSADVDFLRSPVSKSLM